MSNIGHGLFLTLISINIQNNLKLFTNRNVICYMTKWVLFYNTTGKTCLHNIFTLPINLHRYIVFVFGHLNIFSIN
jgi:hypothetical protein